MLNAIVKVRHWWSNGHVAALPVVPFEVACTCGRSVSGQRQLQSLVLPCPGCGRPVFVLPISPFAVDGTIAPPAASPSAPLAGRPIWFWPVIAAGTTLLLAALFFTVLIAYYVSDTDANRGTRRPTAEAVEQHWKEGQRAWADHDFPQALREFSEAATPLEQSPDLLPLARRRLLLNQRREAELLADWANSPKGAKQPELLFGNLNVDPDLLGVYRHHVLVFDVDVRRDPLGQYHIEYRRPKIGDLVRLDVQNFKLLQKLPLTEPLHLIFAARLADARHTADGPWLVTLEPDSGVLLTDIEAANFVTGPPLDQRAEAIQRQTKWVEDSP